MIWCSYRMTGRSHMSIANTSSSFPRAGAFARREQHAALPARGAQRSPRTAAAHGSERAHLAEQAYAAELAHAERVHVRGEKPAGEPPLGMARAVRAVSRVRAQRRLAGGAPEQAAHEHQRGAVTGAPEASARPEPSARAERRRWSALAVLCLGQLMMVLDATIVNVALPSIQRELHFTQQNLTWVMNGYLITFGGFLLLAGRLGDLVGRKKVFLAGLVLFTVASMMCGVAGDQTMLIVARLLQGIGGAVASSVILAIIVTEFPGASEQARAMGLFAFVSAGGGSIGLLAGGALTQSLDWHWIFFVNVPIGILTFVLGWALISENEGIGLKGGVDVLGSILMTA